MSRAPLWPVAPSEPRATRLARIARGLSRIEAHAEACHRRLAALAHRRADLMDQRTRLTRGGGR